jgi:hypothetical protein
MKPILLLSDEAETSRLMLKDVAFEELPVRDTGAHVGCKAIAGDIPVPSASIPTSYQARRLQFLSQQ